MLFSNNCMAFNNDPSNAAPTVDRSSPIGNSPGTDDRGRMHVKAANTNQEPIPVATAGVDWDTITTTFPTSTQDLFTYSKNGVIVQTILVTYDSSNKKTIILTQKTVF